MDVVLSLKGDTKGVQAGTVTTLASPTIKVIDARYLVINSLWNPSESKMPPQQLKCNQRTPLSPSSGQSKHLNGSYVHVMQDAFAESKMRNRQLPSSKFNPSAKQLSVATTMNDNVQNRKNPKPLCRKHASCHSNTVLWPKDKMMPAASSVDACVSTEELEGKTKSARLIVEQEKQPVVLHFVGLALDSLPPLHEEHRRKLKKAHRPQMDLENGHKFPEVAKGKSRPKGRRAVQRPARFNLHEDSIHDVKASSTTRKRKRNCHRHTTDQSRLQLPTIGTVDSGSVCEPKAVHEPTCVQHTSSPRNITLPELWRQGSNSTPGSEGCKDNASRVNESAATLATYGIASNIAKHRLAIFASYDGSSSNQ